MSFRATRSRSICCRSFLWKRSPRSSRRRRRCADLTPISSPAFSTGGSGEAVARRAKSGETPELARIIKKYCLSVLGPGDTQHAQVTRGGADVSEFDSETMESRRVPGLYAVGEALDIDGACGGYNLHWAFASGLRAGRSAARD